jgi:8-oxo-dGTP diphosphatase
MSGVRLSIKAIIIRDGRLLVLRNRDAAGDWYMLPGGGQESGETVPAALRRECQEEIGSDVTVGRLCFIRDYIAKHHEFASTDSGTHQVELMFECGLLSPPRVGSAPDLMQMGIDWLDLGRLAEYRIYPSVLGQLLRSEMPQREAIYLGDVN